MFFAAALLFTGCGGKKNSSAYLAKVNDAYLTEEEFGLLYDTAGISPSRRHELYQHWVRTELLYQRAVSGNIAKDQKFILLAERSKKELAGSMLLNKMANEEKFTCSESELKKYYEDNGEQFRYSDRSFVYNTASFGNSADAERFRRFAIDANWENAARQFKKDSSAEFSGNMFRYAYQLESGLVYRVLSAMMPGETSLVFNVMPGKFIILRLNAAFAPNTVPSLEALRQQIEERVIERKRAEYMDNAVKELYKDAKIEMTNPD